MILNSVHGQNSNLNGHFQSSVPLLKKKNIRLSLLNGTANKREEAARLGIKLIKH
jgi:hypothetical protein